MQVRRKRIRFTAALDELLLKSLLSNDGHISPHGEAQLRFEEALHSDLSALPQSVIQSVHPSTWKTVSDRFKKLVADHLKLTKAKQAVSGIVQIRREREQLLYEIFLAVD